MLPLQSRLARLDLSLKQLPFALDALAPVLSPEAVEVHHRGHQATYVKNYNDLARKLRLSSAPIYGEQRQLLTFNFNGAVLHQMFWENLVPGGSTDGSQQFGAMHEDSHGIWTGGPEESVRRSGRVATPAKALIEVGKRIQGSGWAALLLYVPHRAPYYLKAMPILNHGDETLHDPNCYPICVIDVWEHAYVTDYPALRGGGRVNYLMGLADLINWNVVERRFLKALDQAVA